MHELDKLAAAVGKWREILLEADAIAEIHGYSHRSPDPMAEIAARMPLMLATLSADARNLIAEHLDINSAMLGALVEVIPCQPHLRLVGPA